MKFLTIALLILSLCCTAAVYGQASLGGLGSITDFRPIGETRFWTIIIRDSTIGSLTSTVGEYIEIDGRDGITLRQSLRVDYTTLGQNRLLEIEGGHFVSLTGLYLGDDKTISVNGQAEQLKLKRNGENITGYFTRGGEKVEQDRETEDWLMAYDNFFFDQLELFLALRGLTVDETIEGTIFEPQSMLTMPFKGVVEEFGYMQIHERLSDSVFLINVFEPQQMFLYFSLDRKLQKIELPNQKVRAYLDLVRKPERDIARRPSLDWSAMVRLLPRYLLFAGFGLVSSLFFIGRNYRWKPVYLLFAAGAILFLPAVYLVEPLQRWLVVNWMVPGISGGGSVYWYGLLPALAAGIIQELLKLSALFPAWRILKPSGNRMVALGALCGFGFGFIESCYLDSMVGSPGIFSWSILERGFMILFHTTSGAFIGYALAARKELLPLVMAAMLSINALFRILPLFVQQKVVEVQLMYLLMAFMALMVLFSLQIILKKKLNT